MYSRNTHSYAQRKYGSSNRSSSYRSESSSGSRSFGGGNRSYRNRSSSHGYGRGRRKFKAQTISHDKYIAKAEALVAENVYIPQNKFIDFEIHQIIKANIERKGYENPTKIQDLAIPHVLKGKDVVGLASTGSGKTLAFLLPMLNKAIKTRNEKVLIMVPTRELAEQINEEFFHFSKGTYVRSVLTIGGSSMNKQMFLLKKNPQFVIGTPGRIKDLYNRRVLNLESFNNIVLDEVDRMLDMGFVDEIKFLISKLGSKKQTLFFSATMTKEAKAVADSLLIDPINVEVESQKTSKYVDQNIVKVTNETEKIEKLHDLLIQETFEKVLIFSQTKRGVDKLHRELKDRGFKVDGIHGDKSQFIRGNVIKKFRNNDIKILVATDVAARGLDIPNVTHVINYDEPENYENYIHRIGRTGRGGKKGTALTFVR